MPGSSGRPTAKPAPFGEKDVDQLIHFLAAVGIGVFHVGDPQPEVPITGAASPVRLTDDQARSAALGMWAHAGISGTQLDKLVPAIALRAGAPALPTAAVVAGWASSVDTPAARLARSILGRQSWSSFESIVYPTVILTLFASDITSHALAAEGTYQAVPAAYTRPLTAATAGGVCTGTLDFINSTIAKVFDAIGHLNTDTNVFSKLFGGLAGQILDGITSFGIALINSAIDAARTFVVQGVKIVLGPFLNAIATIAGAVAVATQIGQLLQPWSATLVPDPAANAKGIDAGLPGQIHLTVTTTSGPAGDWPTTIQDCALAAGVTLPPLRPHGGKLTWNLDHQAPGLLAIMTAADPALSDTGTATMHYVTTTEDAQTAKGEPHPGLVLPEATIHRTDLDQLTDKVASLLANAVPNAPDAINRMLQHLLSTALNTVRQQIGIVTKDQQIQTQLVVTYHTPAMTKSSGSCAGSPAGAYRGPVTISASFVSPNLTIRESGVGQADLTVSPTGRLSGTWALSAHVDGDGTERDGRTPINVHLVVADKDGTFSGTLQHPVVTATATESGVLHVGAVNANGPIVTGIRVTTPIAATACPPHITLRYDLPVRIGDITVDGTVLFSLSQP